MGPRFALTLRETCPKRHVCPSRSNRTPVYGLGSAFIMHPVIPWQLAMAPSIMSPLESLRILVELTLGFQAPLSEPQ